MSYKVLEKWGGWGDGDVLGGFVWEVGRGFGNVIIFISLRMDNEFLLVSRVLYICSLFRVGFRCFVDMILSVIVMFWNRVRFSFML